MDSMTHFHSKYVYFYKHHSNSLKVTALDMFQKMGLTPLLNYNKIAHVYVQSNRPQLMPFCESRDENK